MEHAIEVVKQYECIVYFSDTQREHCIIQVEVNEELLDMEFPIKWTFTGGFEFSLQETTEVMLGQTATGEHYLFCHNLEDRRLIQLKVNLDTGEYNDVSYLIVK